MRKNVAGQKFVVFAFNRTTGVALAGDAANITANIRLDHGVAAATTDVNPTETEDGFYTFDAAQAETNANVVQVFPASTTADIQVIAVPGVIYTVPDGFSDAPLATLAGQATIVGYIDTEIGTILTNLAAVSALVSAVQADLDNGADGLGALKILIDAVATSATGIKAKTDLLTFTVANQLDANIQSVNDVPLTGNGSTVPFNV